MAVSRAQTQQEWRLHNQLRRGSYNTWNRAWAEYYLEQGRILLNNINTPNAIFPLEQVSALFVMMYQDVGGRFANISYDRLKYNIVDLQTKASDAFVHTWEEYMANYARTEGALSIVSISNTAQERAAQIIQEATAQAIEEGVGVAELAARVEELVWEEWKITSKFNAARIARTEIIAASNEGAFLGAQSTGLPLRKVWLATPSGDFRPTHLAANGQTVGMNENFNIGGVMMSKPGDKSAPASEVINCRCAVSFTTGLF